MGKTRLAAELATGAHREQAAVLHAAGTGPPEAGLAAIARARGSRRPTLLVLEDADRAPSVVRAAAYELASGLEAVPVLMLATGLGAAALARLGPDETLELAPLGAHGVG